jgi:hypothetical protein
MAGWKLGTGLVAFVFGACLAEARWVCASEIAVPPPRALDRAS